MVDGVSSEVSISEENKMWWRNVKVEVMSHRRGSRDKDDGKTRKNSRVWILPGAHERIKPGQYLGY